MKINPNNELSDNKTSCVYSLKKNLKSIIKCKKKK